MGMVGRLARQSAWVLAARLFAQAAMAVFTILAARRLGGSSFGEYTFMAALVLTGNMLTTFGTDMLLIRTIAANGRLEGLPDALAWQILLSAVFVAGVFLLTPLFRFLSPEGELALRIYSLAAFPLALYTVFSTALRGKGQMGAYAVLNIFLACLQLLVAGWLYLSGGSLPGLAWLLLLAQVLAALFAGLLCTRQITGFWGGWRFSAGGLIRLARASAPLALLGALTILYQRLIPMLLPFLSGALQAGAFFAGSRLVEAARVGHLAAFTALYPAMAASARRETRTAGTLRSFRRAGLLLLGAAGMGALGLSLLAGPLVTQLLGEDYRAAIPVIKILAWSLLPYTFNTFLSLACLATGDQATLLEALAGSLLGLAILTAWWGAAGASGAAWALLAAELVQSILLTFGTARRSGWRPSPARGVHEVPDLS